MSNIDHSSREQAEYRKVLIDLFNNAPLPEDQVLNHLALFNRSSIVARYLHYYELYNLMLNNPGVILIYGYGYGSTIISFLSLRAILEPYNYSRKIIGFDDFKPSDALSYFAQNPDGLTPDKYGYLNAGKDYLDYLRQVVNFHEKENVLAYIPKVELFNGDPVSETGSHLESVKDLKIAVVYFDRTFSENIADILTELKPFIDSETILCPSTFNSYLPTGEMDNIRTLFGNSLQVTHSKFIPDKVYIKNNNVYE